MRDLFALTGKTAVVTGSAGLLGKAISRALADYGSTVYVADLDIKNAKTVCANYNGERGKLIPIRLDITKSASIRSATRKILAKDGRIDIWVNSAYPRTRDWGNIFEKIKPSSWGKNMEQHLNGYCFSCQAIAEEMKKRGGGSIINMASIYGFKGPDFSIYENTKLTMPAAYSVIKAGIINFTRYLACYYGKHGVRVNTISPGGVADRQPKVFIKNYCRKTPLRRMAKPEDIAGAVVYLASDAASYVTGHNLVVDGGITA